MAKVGETEGAIGYCSLALLDDSVVGLSVEGIEPVSYTHLDVYKRQGIVKFK